MHSQLPMNITPEQVAAVEQGEPLRVRAGVELVLLRADLYDQLVAGFDPAETYAAVLEALGDEDPGQYLEYL